MKTLVLRNAKAIVAFVVALVALVGLELPVSVVEPLEALFVAVAVWLIPNQQ